MVHIGQDDLDRFKKENREVRYVVYGILLVDTDVDVNQLRDYVTDITVYGIVRAPKEVKQQYRL